MKLFVISTLCSARRDPALFKIYFFLWLSMLLPYRVSLLWTVAVYTWWSQCLHLTPIQYAFCVTFSFKGLYAVDCGSINLVVPDDFTTRHRINVTYRIVISANFKNAKSIRRPVKIKRISVVEYHLVKKLILFSNFKRYILTILNNKSCFRAQVTVTVLCYIYSSPPAGCPQRGWRRTARTTRWT